MKIKSILVSQPAPAIVEKSPYYEIQAKYNLKVEYFPFIKVEGITLKEFRSQRIDILAHTVIVFTSRTTVDHFFRICEEARITIPETMKYICYTEAIAFYLQKYIVYRKRKIFYANGSFDDFIDLIVKHKKELFLLPLSEPHKPELPLAMEKLKLRFDKIILSHTVGADLGGIDLADYDLLVFFSPAEINSLLSAFGRDNLPLIATFGEGTTRTALESGLTVSFLAPTPEAPSMSKAIDLFVSKINSGKEVPPVQLPVGKATDDLIKSSKKSPKKPQPAKAETEAKPRGNNTENKPKIDSGKQGEKS